MTSQSTTQSATPLSWLHPVASVGARGITVDRTASTTELERLVAALEVVSVDAFHAVYTITLAGNRSYLMTGNFNCQLNQACVVTLEPVVQNIAENFSVSFCPPGRVLEPEEKERPVLDAPDVEVLTGDVIEAGRVMFELLSAALDPYPRKSDADFSWQDPKTSPQDVEILHPFAALSKLKNNN